MEIHGTMPEQQFLESHLAQSHDDTEDALAALPALTLRARSL